MKKLILIAFASLCLSSSIFANCPANDADSSKMPPLTSASVNR